MNLYRWTSKRLVFPVNIKLKIISKIKMYLYDKYLKLIIIFQKYYTFRSYITSMIFNCQNYIFIHDITFDIYKCQI